MILNFYNINEYDYKIEFHDINLFVEKNNYSSFQYLYSVNVNSTFNKKYLLNLNYESFKKFLYTCISIGDSSTSKTNFEAQCIQLINKYYTYSPTESRHLFNHKLGNLLLFNSKFCNFEYLKKIEKIFMENINQANEQNIDPIYEIKYLLIIVKNLLVMTRISPQSNYNFDNTNNKILFTDEIFLEFIFDYYN